MKRPDPEKVAALQQLRPARTKREARQLIGFFQWFRNHIDNFAEIAAPLTDLTSKKFANNIPWTDVHTQALDRLKQALWTATDKCLFLADFTAPFNVSTDASDHTVAGILTQSSVDNTERPIAFFSQKLTPTQRAWSTIEKEAYAVIASLRHFRQWIWGSETFVYSDHNPLTYLAEASGKSAKLTRWFLALQDYRVHFRYKRGKLNVAPDCLTRMSNPDEFPP